jgi:hypothetical protein
MSHNIQSWYFGAPKRVRESNETNIFVFFEEPLGAPHIYAPFGMKKATKWMPTYLQYALLANNKMKDGILNVTIISASMEEVVVDYIINCNALLAAINNPDSGILTAKKLSIDQTGTLQKHFQTEWFNAAESQTHTVRRVYDLKPYTKKLFYYGDRQPMDDAHVDTILPHSIYKVVKMTFNTKTLKFDIMLSKHIGPFEFYEKDGNKPTGLVRTIHTNEKKEDVFERYYSWYKGTYHWNPKNGDKPFKLGKMKLPPYSFYEGETISFIGWDADRVWGAGRKDDKHKSDKWYDRKCFLSINERDTLLNNHKKFFDSYEQTSNGWKTYYRESALQNHPDKPGGSVEAMQQLNAMNDVLKNKCASWFNT